MRGWCFSSHFIHFLFTQDRAGGSSDTWHLTNPQYFTNRSPHDGNPIEATIHPTYSISITQYIFAPNIQVISFWGKCNFLSKWWEEKKLPLKITINTPSYCQRCFCFHSNIPTTMTLERNNRNPLFATFGSISFSVLCSTEQGDFSVLASWCFLSSSAPKLLTAIWRQLFAAWFSSNNSGKGLLSERGGL